jgi:hypothetical protein
LKIISSYLLAKWSFEKDIISVMHAWKPWYINWEW